MRITLVAGARPNFMKVAPIIKAIEAAKANRHEISYRLIHTGQHFDKVMSADFFEQLGIPEPNVDLGAGGGTQAEQTAAILVGFERELLQNRPDVVLVVGDVTSTMACAISAKKLSIRVGHVEAGIRSGDMTMPEEINRIVTDSISDHFFTTSRRAGNNLVLQGVNGDEIFFVGNTMIDTLLQNLSRLQRPEIWDKHRLAEKGYFLLTLHRPANVDKSEKLFGFLNSILQYCETDKIVFPVHPRTRPTLDQTEIHDSRLLDVNPLGYLEFIYLLKNAKAVITDSGGITEEASVLGIPCMTLRDSTERPETIAEGTNELVGTDPANLQGYIEKLNDGGWKNGSAPELWDGRAAERIVNVLIEKYN